MTIAAQQTYDAYKISGIDWVGQIPVTWDQVANKHLFRLRKTQVGKRSSEYDLLSLTLRGIIKRDMKNPEGKFPAEFDTYQEVRPGDFVFCHFDVEETPRTVGLSTHHGMITGAYTVYEPTGDADSGFLYYYYLHADTDKKLRSLYKGLRNTIPKDTFAAFKTPLPPLPEQRAIAAFLDGKCATIDEAVRIKEEQIRLLAERRQILIQEAVTRGLNPKAPMKDSGIDWIGQIPAHWEVKRFKSVATAFGRIGFRGYSTSDLVDKGEGAVTLSPSNLSDGLMRFEKCSYLSWKKYQESPEIQVEEGDVLVVKTGSTGKTGFVRKLPEPATINPQLVVLKNLKCASEFLYHLISSPQFQAEVKRRAIGSTIPTISESRLLGIDLQVPPRDEQNEIIDHINAVSGQIDAVIALKGSQITALREYKTSLINAAVTGKIKVF